MGGIPITTDCRVPVGQLYASPGMYGGPHTCTAANPCDARVTVTEFLLARIAEDEEVARKTAPVDQRWNYLLWVRFDSARVLAECEAKRKIVEFHESWPTLVQTPAKFERDDGNLDNYVFRMSQEIAWLTTREYVARFGIDPPTAPMLAALVALYADHPDYLPEWNQSVENERSQVQPATSSAPIE
jgi:hypothetical protein